MKAIDWYLIVCFLFVFGVLFEYTLVLYIDNVYNRKKKRRSRNRKKVSGWATNSMSHFAL